jgi:hypothetical protein
MKISESLLLCTFPISSANFDSPPLSCKYIHAYLRCKKSSTPLIGDAGIRRPSLLTMRGVVDSEYQQSGESPTPCIGDPESRRFLTSEIRGCAFPRIPSQNKRNFLRICITNFVVYGKRKIVYFLNSSTIIHEHYSTFTV